MLTAAPAGAVTIYSTFGPAPGTPGDGVEPFVERIQQVSGLHFDIKTPADLGVDRSQLLSMVAHGAIEMAVMVPIIQDRDSEARNIEISLYGESFPFGLQLEEYLSWHYDDGGRAGPARGDSGRRRRRGGDVAHAGQAGSVGGHVHRRGLARAIPVVRVPHALVRMGTREQRTWQERGHVARGFRFEAWGPD